MKNLILILLCLTYFNGISQTKAIDSLIQKIDNKDVYIVLVKTMSPRIQGDIGNEIIKIGAPATQELIKILDDRNKGIIAHVILSKIWKNTWAESICCDIITNEKTEIIYINGLKIYIEDNHLFSKIDDLKTNKEHWKKRINA